MSPSRTTHPAGIPAFMRWLQPEHPTHVFLELKLPFRTRSRAKSG